MGLGAVARFTSSNPRWSTSRAPIHTLYISLLHNTTLYYSTSVPLVNINCNLVPRIKPGELGRRNVPPTTHPLSSRALPEKHFPPNLGFLLQTKYPVNLDRIAFKKPFKNIYIHLLYVFSCFFIALTLQYTLIYLDTLLMFYYFFLNYGIKNNFGLKK